MDKSKYKLRDARDTLIDMLLDAQGTTYPVPDLPVRPENPIVLYNNPARILVSFSQQYVGYMVYDDKTRKVNEEIKGNGGDLFIETGPLTEQDYTFNVIATKTVSGNSKQLLQTVTVKVGVNTALAVTPKEAFFNYGTWAAVTVVGAQSGAIYQVFDLKDNPLSGGVISNTTGDLDIVTTDPVKEDIQVKVKVTNNKTGVSGVLTMQPELLVSPNTALPVKPNEPVTGYNGKAIITIENTQETVLYQLRFEDIDDDRPEKKLPENTGIGIPVKGNGGSIDLPVDALQEDLTVTILATKIKSGIEKELATRVTIMVKPDPDKKLSIVEEKIEPEKGATIKVSNSQPGVLYQLQSPEGNNIGRPGYHHKNYGIGKARLGIEFAVDAFTGDSVFLPTGPLDKTTTFQVLAIKATTGQTATVGSITVVVE